SHGSVLAPSARGGEVWQVGLAGDVSGGFYAPRTKPDRGPGQASQAARIARRSSAFRLAPPTSAPLTFGTAISSRALSGFTEPPYRSRMAWPSAPKRSDSRLRRKPCTSATSATDGTSP